MVELAVGEMAEQEVPVIQDRKEKMGFLIPEVEPGDVLVTELELRADLESYS